MEIALKKILFFSIVITFIITTYSSEFIKPKKALPEPKVKVEDVCAQTLPLVHDAGQLLKELGCLQEQLAELVSPVLENDKKSSLKCASQKQLQELLKKEEQLQKLLQQITQELHAFNNYVQNV